jgi:hypothetical protein
MQGNHNDQKQTKTEEQKRTWTEPTLMLLDMKSTEGGQVTLPFENTYYSTFTGLEGSV